MVLQLGQLIRGYRALRSRSYNTLGLKRLVKALVHSFNVLSWSFDLLRRYGYSWSNRPLPRKARNVSVMHIL